MAESDETAGDTSEGPLSSDEYRAIYHSVNDAIFVHDAETYEIVDVNETMCEMYGYSRAEARELSVEELSSGNPPYTQDNAAEYIQQAAQGEPQIFEWQAEDSQGRVFWVEVSMRRAVVDDNERILVIVRNIDERKRAQEEEAFLHSLLRHDLTNKIQVMDGNLEVIEQMDISPDVRDLIGRARDAARESTNLIEKVRTLRAVANESERELKSVDNMIRQTVETYEPRAEEAGIDIDFEPVESRIRCNPLVDQLFANLVENAIKHSNGSKIRIFGEERGDVCHVSVVDDGDGIPEDQRRQIMERGVSQGDAGGSGLGLSLVEKIVENHGGEIEVTDSEMGGARFDVALPKYPPE